MEIESSIDQLKYFLKEMFQFNTNDLDFGIYRIYNLKRKEIENFIDGKDANCLEPIILKTLELVANNEKHTELASLRAYLKDFNKEDLLDDPSNNYGKIEQLIINFGTDDFQKENLISTLKTSSKGISITDEIKDKIYNHILSYFEMYYSNGDFGYNNRSRNLYKVPYEADYDGTDTLFHWKHKGSIYIKTGNSFNAIKFKIRHLDKEFELRLETNESSSDEEVARNNNKETKLKHYKFNRFEEKDLVTRIVFNLSDSSTTKADLFISVFTEVFKSSINLEKYLFADGKPVFNDLTDDYDKVQDGAVKGIGVLRVNRKTLLNKVNKNFGKGEKIEVLIKDGQEIFSDTTLETIYNIDQKLNSFYIGNDSDYFIHENLQEFLTSEKDRYIKNHILSDLESILNGKLDNTTIIIARAFELVSSRIIEFLSTIEEFQKKLFTMKKKVVESEYCLTIDNIDEKFYKEILANKAQVAEWELLFSVKVKTVEDLKAHPTLVLDTKFFSEKNGCNAFKDKILETIENLDEKLNGLLINSENYQGLNLIQELFRDKIQAIYLDPPYNTGGDEGFIYKDNFKHSSWLALMENRLVIAKSLLKSNGTFGISIDINELHRAVTVMNMQFGKLNEKAIVTVKRGSVTGAKVINPGLVNISEYLLIYSNDPNNWENNKIFKEKQRDTRYNGFIINRDKDHTKWLYTTILEAFAEFKKIKKSQLKKILGDKYETELEEFIFLNSKSIFQPANLDENSISEEAVKMKHHSEKNPGITFKMAREAKNDYYILNGKVLLFFEDRLIDVGGKKVYGELVADIWDDVLPNDIHNEGGVKLRKGKKPEKFIYRYIDLATKKDCKHWVLDYFGGSGTTAGVALKSQRKFVLIEMAKYFNTLTLPRVKNALFGEQSGISKAVNWYGGGIVKYNVVEQYEDVLDAIEKYEGDTPKGLPIKYLYKPELNKLTSTLDLSKPFTNLIKYGQPTKEGYVDLVETYNYLLGYEIKSIKTYTLNKKYYKVIETDSNLVIWRDISLGEDDSKNIITIAEKYPEASSIEINFDFNLLAAQKGKQLKVGNRELSICIIHSDIFNQ